MPRGPAQELPARAGEHVATDLRDVERQVPDRLRGIEQIGNAGVARDPADLRNRVDETAAGRNVRHPDQTGAVVDHRRQRAGVELTVLVVRHDEHLDPATLRELEIGEDVAPVLVAPRQDPIAAPERQRVERGIPSVRRVVEQRDLVRLSAHELGDGVVGGGDPSRGLRSGLVAADLRLALEMADHGLKRVGRQQAGAGVVEVDAGGASRRRSAERLDVERGTHATCCRCRVHIAGHRRSLAIPGGQEGALLSRASGRKGAVLDTGGPSMDGIERFDRVPLLFGPSPVHRLERLSEHLGGAVDIWAKREDCNSGLAYGGNKVRKLEYLAADALAQGCDTLVSIGGVQSNHTRQVAAVAARLGLGCVLVQEHWVEWPDAVYDKVGNILLSRIMGADVRLDPAGFDIGIRQSWEDALARSSERAASRTRSRPVRPTIRSAGSGSRAGPTRWPSRNASSASSSTRSSSAR